MGSKAVEATKVYRHLLKSVKKHIGSEDHKRHFKDFISAEFQKSRSLSDQLLIESKLKLAHNYTYLLNSVQDQKNLLFSYNIAIDRSDEMKRILGKSAASVGLQLPEVYKPWNGSSFSRKIFWN